MQYLLKLKALPASSFFPLHVHVVVASSSIAPMEEQAAIVETKNGRAAMSPPLPSPPGRNNNVNNMVVVQFPKDQIYRVPPRENAEFMERYRNPPNTKRRRRNCCCRCPRALLTLALILVAVIAVLAITLASLFFILNPIGPTFSITHVAVKNTTPPEYEVSMRARNTNERLGMVYEDSEVALLVEDSGDKVAEGRFPRLEQDRDGSTQVKILLTGTKGAKSVGGGKLNARVGFDLEMGLRVRVSLGGFNTWVMTANVVCEFDVSGLGNGTRILSQHCDTKFRQY